MEYRMSGPAVPGEVETSIPPHDKGGRSPDSTARMVDNDEHILESRSGQGEEGCHHHDERLALVSSDDDSSFCDEPIAHTANPRLVQPQHLWLGGSIIFMGLTVFAFLLHGRLAILEKERDPTAHLLGLRPSVSAECTDSNWTIANMDEYLGRFRTNYTPNCFNVGQGPRCHCPNPVVGSMPQKTGWWNESWQESNAANQQRIREAIQAGRSLDVILLGDSITEHWQGTDLGRSNPDWDGNARVYHETFTSEDSPVQGLALGNGGDRTTQLLYRLEHGEIDPLEAPVLWILIGTNDLLGVFCASEEVVAGILSIVRQVRLRKPASTIVLQALLPVSSGNIDNEIGYWHVYSQINQRLACFAEQAPWVRFVNMTDLFLTSNSTVDVEMLVDGLHPGEVASRLMGQRIVRVVQDILGENRYHRRKW